MKTKYLFFILFLVVVSFLLVSNQKQKLATPQLTNIQSPTPTPTVFQPKIDSKTNLISELENTTPRSFNEDLTSLKSELFDN